MQITAEVATELLGYKMEMGLRVKSHTFDREKRRPANMISNERQPKAEGWAVPYGVAAS